jgi:hypothetical protein
VKEENQSQQEADDAADAAEKAQIAGHLHAAIRAHVFKQRAKPLSNQQDTSE